MSVVKPPVISEIFGRSGLSEFECKALHDEAYRLMVDGRAMGVGQDEDEDGIKCVYVLDLHGNHYTVARNAAAYLLLGPGLGVIGVSRRFDDILEALRNEAIFGEPSREYDEEIAAD